MKSEVKPVEESPAAVDTVETDTTVYKASLREVHWQQIHDHLADNDEIMDAVASQQPELYARLCERAEKVPEHKHHKRKKKASK
jgi:hypothetical protein